MGGCGWCAHGRVGVGVEVSGCGWMDGAGVKCEDLVGVCSHVQCIVILLRTNTMHNVCTLTSKK